MTDSYHFQIEPEPRATICFDDVKARTIALAKISRCAAVDALAVFSVARARELMPWEWASYVAHVDDLLSSAAANSIGPFPSGATLKVAGDKITGRIAPEPIRPALDWNTATPFDTFGADFIVTKGEVPTAPLHTSPTTDSAYPAIAGLLRG